MFIWVPVFVEYIYVLGSKMGFYKAIARYLLIQGCGDGSNSKEMEPEGLDAHGYGMVEQQIATKADEPLVSSGEGNVQQLEKP